MDTKSCIFSRLLKHNIIGLFLKGQNLPALVVVLATTVAVVVGVFSAVLDKKLEILDHLIKSRIWYHILKIKYRIVSENL